MRVLVLAVAIGISACAPPAPGNQMASEGDGAPAPASPHGDSPAFPPGPTPSPVSPPAPAPGPATAPSPIAAQATEPDDAAAAKALVDRYYAAIAAGRYRDAWALWRRQGAASGMTAAAFADSFDRYASYDATVGAPFDADAGAGQRYISVPVTIRGRLKSGGPFMLEGPLHLHKVADGIESDDPNAHEWRIDTSAIRPRPDLAR